MNNKDDPYNMTTKSLDELLRIISGRKKSALDHQYAKIELEKRKTASQQNVTSDKTSDIPDSKHNVREKTLKAIAIGVIIVVLSACVIWIINYHFGLNLK